MSDGMQESGARVPRTYSLNPEQFAQVRRKLIIRAALVTPPLIAVFWYLQRAQPRDRFDLLFFPVLFVWIVYSSIRREQEKWNSLTLEIRDDTLVRTLPNYPVLEIVPSEVTRIIESRHGLMIKTNSRLRFLFVHHALLGYDDFRCRVATWAQALTIETVQENRSILAIARSWLGVAACICLFGGPLYMMYTPYQWLIRPLGVCLVIAFAAMIFYYWRSPIMPKSFRYTAWILVALPLTAMIIRLM